MKNITKEMVDIYKTYDRDWMNFVINDELTYHHIEKAENGGIYSLDNGALLTHRAHTYLHKMEAIDNEIYIEINEIFKEINMQKHEITDLQRFRIQLLLLKYELRNADKLTKKKEKLGKNKRYVTVLRRLNLQEMR